MRHSSLPSLRPPPLSGSTTNLPASRLAYPSVSARISARCDPIPPRHVDFGNTRNAPRATLRPEQLRVLLGLRYRRGGRNQIAGRIGCVSGTLTQGRQLGIHPAQTSGRSPWNLDACLQLSGSRTCASSGTLLLVVGEDETLPITQSAWAIPHQQILNLMTREMLRSEKISISASSLRRRAFFSLPK